MLYVYHNDVIQYYLHYQSHWRESWKSALVVNAHLVWTTPQSGNWFHLRTTNLMNLSVPVKGIAEPVERLGALQTLICAPVMRPK